MCGGVCAWRCARARTHAGRERGLAVATPTRARARAYVSTTRGRARLASRCRPSCARCYLARARARALYRAHAHRSISNPPIARVRGGTATNDTRHNHNPPKPTSISAPTAGTAPPPHRKHRDARARFTCRVSRVARAQVASVPRIQDTRTYPHTTTTPSSRARVPRATHPPHRHFGRRNARNLLHCAAVATTRDSHLVCPARPGRVCRDRVIMHSCSYEYPACATLKQACSRWWPRAQLAFKDSMIHVLQIALGIAVCRVLHRCGSLDIHRQELCVCGSITEARRALRLASDVKIMN